MQIHISHPRVFEAKDAFLLGGLLTSSSLPGPTPQGAFPGSANVPTAEPLLVDARENKLQKGARVAYGRKLRRMTLQRYLCSLIAYEEDKVSFQDVVTLYDNILWCQEKAEADPHFRQKFGQSLTVLAEILKGIRFHPHSFRTTLKTLSRELKAKLEHFIYPKRNLPGIELHVKGHYQVIPHRESGTLTKQLPRKRRIGVGYRDKGHRRDPAWDASPSWQEVAQSNLP